ncbi:HNH endonuclease signature motif containing protein [Halosolutus gelatinilyticus]|uniref:HNH endonuclease signature motif containing protein n=1 Tax=Halosolutus gelatinilyticus TaxID=2931975 RepID=UPI001FF506E1|nr:HNH endonuclease signature motif containing protein [Halosolutus gelatinilyticus]
MQKELEIPDENPWNDRELMMTLYHDQELSSNQIADLFDCSQATVSNWLKRHGIETRSIQQALSTKYGNYAKLQMHQKGYECWRADKSPVLVHRLVMVAEHGFEAIQGKKVHHKNEIPWDNRPDNLELLSRKEHQRKHLKVTGLDRIRVAEMYEHGDCGSRTVGDLFGISNGTVLRIHSEFYDDELE